MCFNLYTILLIGAYLVFFFFRKREATEARFRGALNANCLLIILLLQGCSSKPVSPFPSQNMDTVALRQLVNLLDSAGLYDKALDIEGILTGENSPQYATLLNHLGDYYCFEGKERQRLAKDYGGDYYNDEASKSFSSAYELLSRALKIRRDVLGQHHPDYAASIFSLGGYYFAREDYAKAIEYFSSALDLLCETLGEQNPVYLSCREKLGACYAALDNFEKANEYGYVAESDSLAQDESSAGYTAEYIEAQTNHSLEYAYRQAHRADSAFRAGGYFFLWAAEAIEILRDSLGDKNPEYAKALSLFGDNYLAADLAFDLFWNLQPISGWPGFTDSAISCYEEALDIQKSHMGESHPDYFKTLFGLSCCKSYSWEYEDEREQWESTMKGALEKIGHTLGKKHPDYLRRLLMLGDLCYPSVEDKNAFREAFGYYTEAITIMENDLSLRRLHHELYLTALVRVGTICEIEGSTQMAIDYYSRARDEGDSEDYILHRLASCYYDKKDYSKAIELGKRVLAYYEDQGIEHQDVDMIIGNSLYELGRYEEAIPYYLRTSDYWGRTNYRSWRAPDMIGRCYQMIEDYPEAILYYLVALNIDETEGLYREYDRHSIRDLSICFDKLNTSNLAVKYYQKYIRNVIQLFREELSHSLISAANYWDNYQKCFYLELPYFAFRNSVFDDLLMTTYDGLLASKGFLLNAETELRKLIMEKGDKDAIALYDELSNNKERLDSLRHSATFDADELKQVEEDYKDLSDRLVQKSRVFGNYINNLSISWQDVQSKLGKRDIAIEFMEVPISADSTVYCALTLKKGYSAPHFFELFDLKDLNALKAKYARKDGRIYEDEKLYNLVWKPLEEELKGVEKIYFGPSAELYQIAIEYAYKGKRPFSDQKNIYRLSSTRQLAIDYGKAEHRRSTVFGGMNYDAPEEVLIADRAQSTASGASEDEFYDVTSIANRGTGGELLPFDSLPGTGIEAKEISELLQNKGFDNTLKLGEAGTESAFKSFSGKQENIIHIATHGFYWDGRQAEKLGDRLGRMEPIYDDTLPEQVREDASMTQSGLIFSGANNALREDFEKKEGMDDGILTAKEIAKLDFRGADLLVLSACQTGLGEVSGEGVFGLQRGFKKAGVNTILMSLWEVDDEATQLLMTTFYKKLTAGKSKRDALKAAQKTVRNNKDQDFSSPYYWAAFILLDGME